MGNKQGDQSQALTPQEIPRFLSFLRKSSSLMESILDEGILLSLQEKEAKMQNSEHSGAISAQNDKGSNLFIRSLIMKWSIITDGRKVTSFFSFPYLIILTFSLIIYNNPPYFLFFN